MKKIFLGLTLLLAGSLQAQQFQPTHQLPLPDSVQNHELIWTDLDNDGFLDILLTGATSSGNQFFLCYKGDSIQAPLWKSTYASGLTNASYLITDYDLDNDMDIIVSGQSSSGPLTRVMLNESNFTFTTQSVMPREARVIKMTDLSEDGKRELVLSGVESGIPFFSIYREVNNQWQLAHDSIKVKATSVEVFDFDIDGRNDLFISGRDAGNEIVTAIYYNKGNLFLKRNDLNVRVDGRTNVGDINHDGYFDIVLAGINHLNQLSTVKLMNQRRSFNLATHGMTFQNEKNLIADFNSDGLADLHVKGLDGSGTLINRIVRNDGTIYSLPGDDLVAHAFGDVDRDGDLDLAQSEVVNSLLRLQVYKNADTASNKGPGKITYTIGARIYNRAFMFWTKPTDDHTPDPAITYDLSVGTETAELALGEYDLNNLRRLTVSNGSNGPNNYALLKIPEGGFFYSIQPIDNAFYTKERELCSGGVGESVRCETQTLVQTIPACKKEVVTLEANPGTLWFSFKDGFLDIASSMKIEAESTDTIFSVTPGVVDPCAAIKIYKLNVTEILVKKTFSKKTVCEGVAQTFSVEDGFQVSWSSHLKGFLSNDNAISFSTTQNDTVKVTLTNGTGCVLQRNTALLVSKPVVTLNGEVFTILKGGEVQLMASGGEHNKWTPPTNLSSDTIASPIAFPPSTTEYTVIVTDSVGCEASAKVLIIVEGTAFVPNLFTPNDDGKNDELRIYGLSSADNFSFTIHNREGSLVYETTDAVEASSVGWNGTVHGNKQPNGVYFWKVKGKLAGKPLLLNGKTSGSIVLLR